MVQLKSFKIIEPTVAQVGGLAQLEGNSDLVASETTAAGAETAQQQQRDEPARVTIEDKISSQAVDNQQQQLSQSVSISSSASNSPKLPRSGGGGGNLTSSDSGSEQASAKSRSERKRRKTSGQQRAPSGHQDQQTITARRRDHQPEEAELSEPTTLSSNEEYQLARVEMGPEREVGDDDEQSESLSGGSEVAIAGAVGVTRIDIKLPKGSAKTMNPSEGLAPDVGLDLAHQTRPRQQSRHQIELNTEPLMRRVQTSPSQLDQMVERGRLTGPPAAPPTQQQQAQPHQSPALRSIQSMANFSQLQQKQQQPDSVSQHSFALQAKYAGSNHFEIRWHNVRLFARPKSRLPSFISDNPIYKSLIGVTAAAAGADSDSGNGPLGSQGTTNYLFDPVKPPYSPPLNHHKIPPTIDEHSEMRCPSGGGGQKETPLGPAALSTTSLARGQRAGTPPTASQQQQVRCVLNNISGQVFSGQMTAVLGPSGVGKTSLLNSLTGRNTMEGTGRVSLIGAQESKRMSVVTVPQNDVLPGKLTTLEDLQFTSRLKNPQARFDHGRNIERLVKHLHMEKFLHTRIDKLSGGEARRLSIARELLASPDIMILDEPTSGLDANTCKKIITALRDIVEHSDNILDKPMSIIITIHQPQQEVYQLFHRVYVMAVGGRVVFEGSPQMLLPTLLEQSSLERVCPQTELNENPAIVAIEVASGEFGEQVIDELAIYHESQVYEEFSQLGGMPGFGIGNYDSPMMTPRSLGGGGRFHFPGTPKTPRVAKSPMSLHRKRINSFDSSLGRPTPQLPKRGVPGVPGGGGGGMSPQMERMSSMTSISYASTYDEYLPEVTSRLKVDKRLRRSVVIKSHFISHTMTLIARCWLLTRRDMFLMAIRILGFLMVAGGTVQIFSHALDPDEHQCPQFESEIDDMMGYIGQVRTRLLGLLGILRQGNSVHLFFFHLLLCITMVTSALTGLVFPMQMRMFIREYKNGWYSPASFIMSQTIAELPADIIGPLLAVVISYPLCHQPDSAYHWRLIGYSLVIIVTSVICKSQAQIVGAFLMNSVENSVFISCVCVVGPALLSGVPLRVKEMSTPLQWASYGSFLRYAFESLMELRYGYGMCPCDPDLVQGPLHASSSAIPPHLENLALGLLDLSRTGGENFTTIDNPSVAGSLVANMTAMAINGGPAAAPENENLFIKFLRLTTDASNMYRGGKDIEQCSTYRSLYLIGLGIPPGSLVFWACLMVAVFVFSRVLTYFAVKTVIKLRG